MVELKDQLIADKEQEAIEARKKFESNISNVWGHSAVGCQAKQAAMSMLSTKSGLYARIPITCKSDNCPYAETCTLLPYGLAPLGEKCPWETALIETRYAEYLEDYNLDDSSFTDKTLIAELINIDVMLERTKALLSKEEVPITDVVAGMTESGEMYTRPEISKAFELYERNLNRREKILDSMLGTRKSKKRQDSGEKSFNDLLSEAINGTEFIIEETPDEFKNKK